MKLKRITSQDSIASKRLGMRGYFLFSLLSMVVAGCGGGGGDVNANVDTPVLGKTAPDISFEDLDDGEMKKLSSFRGKIVVADFWASWCGPCQEPMAKMQTYREKHPEWGDTVELIAVSIDDTQDAAKNHLKERGWDQTRNVWIPEARKSAATRAYAGKGIPAAYVVDASGVIVKMGHPGRMDLSTIIADLLKKAAGSDGGES